MHKILPPDNKSLKTLKTILEKEYRRPFSDDEVRTLGDFLIGFYSKLANNTLGIGHAE